MRFNKSSIGANTGGLPATSIDSNGNARVIKSYDAWQSMINRCYSDVYHRKNPSYVGCSVSKEWLYYPSFKEWFDNNYIDGYQIDKDLKVDGNKVYSKETCRFVHPHINSLLTDHKRKRGKYPQGVTRHRYGFQSRINKRGENYNLGSFKTADEASEAYKKEKELHVKEIAAEYLSQGLLDEDTFKYLMKWKVK